MFIGVCNWHFFKTPVFRFLFLTSNKKACLFSIILYICLKLKTIGGLQRQRYYLQTLLGVEPQSRN